MSVPIVEQVRSRMMERIEQLRARAGAFRPQLLGGRIGRGQLINNVMTTVDQVMTRIKERKPGIIPSVSEAFQRWRPGSRVAELLRPSAVSLRTETETGGGTVTSGGSGGAIKLRG